jgi:hypothetical protein
MSAPAAATWQHHHGSRRCFCFVADAALSGRVPLFARSGHKAAMARVGVGQQHAIIGT